MNPRRLALLLWVLAAVLFTATALAEEPAKISAREHFNHGVELFDQRRFGDALVAFERSYQLFPVYGTLYNIGQVQVALGRPVEAIAAFEQYLAQGGAALAPEVRARVEAELKVQGDRVGDLKLDVAPEGAEVRIDGHPVGKAPLAQTARVTAGPHRVEVVLDGYRSEQRAVEVPPRGQAELTIALRPMVLLAQSGAPPTPAAPSPNPTIGTEPAATSASRGRTQRIIGYTLAGVGLSGAAVGLAVAVAGQSKHEHALRQWAAGQKDAARKTEADSSDQKTKGYVIMGIGGAVALVGAIALLTLPSGSGRTRWNLSPWITASLAGASVRGTWR